MNILATTLLVIILEEKFLTLAAFLFAVQAHNVG